MVDLKIESDWEKIEKNRENAKNHGYHGPIANFTALAQKHKNSWHCDTVKKMPLLCVKSFKLGFGGQL